MNGLVSIYKKAMLSKAILYKISTSRSYKSFGFILLANTFSIILLALILPVYYESDDDVMMLLIASGGYSGSPDAHLVFINYVYGLLLSLFYTFLPEIEWYTVYFLVIHIISLSIISWCIINSRKTFSHCIIFLIFFFIIEVWIILKLQFTTTAAICATAAMILFLSKELLSQRTIAILLFVVASLIRFDAAFLVLCICSPLITFQFLRTKRKTVYALLIVCLGLSSFTLKLVDAELYKSDPVWAEYKEYNYYRGKINDNPNAKSFINLPIGITHADYNLLLCFFPDTNILDNNAIRQLYQSLDKVNIKNKLSHIIQTFKDYSTFFIFISCSICIQLIFLRDKNKRILLALSYLWLLLVVSYVSLDGYLKFRVFITAILPFCWILFITQEERNKMKYSYSSIIIVLLLLAFTNNILEERKLLRYARKVTNNELNIIYSQKKLDKDEFIISYPSSIRSEHTNPFYISEKYKKNRFLCLGWLSKIPFHVGKLDSHLDLINKNTIYIEKTYFHLFMKDMKDAILTNYNMHINFEILLETDNIYLIKLIESPIN